MDNSNRHAVSRSRKLKFFIERTLERLGLSAWITNRSSNEEVLSLIRLLRPFETGLELIRVGGDMDGGYLLPDDLEGLSECFSPGVDITATFERALEGRSIRSHLADFSVETPPKYLVGCTFLKKFLASYNSDKTVQLADWVQQQSPGVDDLLLQMDIEGAEYEVLSAVPIDVLKRFRIIVIELHYLQYMSNPTFLKCMRGVLNRLNEEFVVCHLHPNNCLPCINVGAYRVPSLVEVTFLRRDRVKALKPVVSLPHALDRPNVPHNRDISLCPEWLEST